MAKADEITDQDIEDGLNFVAGLIDRHGDAYWPIFERLERELDERQSRRAKLDHFLTTKASNRSNATNG